jgi:hypothetical protein
MNKERTIELLNANSILLEEAAKIIGYNNLEGEIMLNKISTSWALDKDSGYLSFDRYNKGDMNEYFPLTISSLGNKGEDLFMGESDGLTFIMAYDNDDWEDTAIFIFDNENKTTFDYE